MGCLINKEEAVEALGARPISWTDSDYELGRQNQYDEDMEAVVSVPSIDIVRCKECKYRDPEDKKCDCGHDIIWQLPRNDNWFCADGERRNDADTN